MNRPINHRNRTAPGGAPMGVPRWITFSIPISASGNCTSRPHATGAGRSTCMAGGNGRQTGAQPIDHLAGEAAR